MSSRCLPFVVSRCPSLDVTSRLSLFFSSTFIDVTLSFTPFDVTLSPTPFGNTLSPTPFGNTLSPTPFGNVTLRLPSLLTIASLPPTLLFSSTSGAGLGRLRCGRSEGGSVFSEDCICLVCTYSSHKTFQQLVASMPGSRAARGPSPACSRAPSSALREGTPSWAPRSSSGG